MLTVNHVERATIERLDLKLVPAPARLTFLFRTERDLCHALRVYLARCTATHYPETVS